MSIRKTTYIHKSRSNKKDMPSAVDDAADVMSKYSKNKKKNSSALVLDLSCLITCNACSSFGVVEGNGAYTR